MASIKIKTWTYVKTERTESSFDCHSFQPKEHGETKVETVTARFEIQGGEPFSKTKRSTNKVSPEALLITFRSVGGGAWGADYGVRLTGSNIKKDGTLGAEQEVRSYDFPRWAEALYELDADGRSDALDWVRSEYPR